MSEQDYIEDQGHCCCSYCKRERQVKIVTMGLDDKEYISIKEQRERMEL
jgi:hypothetical protein